MKNKLSSLALLAGLTMWIPSFAVADTQTNTCNEVEKILSSLSKENLIQIRDSYSTKIKWGSEIERAANEENAEFVACVDSIIKKSK